MEKKQVTELKRLNEKRNTFMEKVKALDAQINELLANIQVKNLLRRRIVLSQDLAPTSCAK
jgi:hypothetical protein